MEKQQKTWEYELARADHSKSQGVQHTLILPFVIFVSIPLSYDYQSRTSLFHSTSSQFSNESRQEWVLPTPFVLFSLMTLLHL